MLCDPVATIKSTISDVFNYWCCERPDVMLASDETQCVTYAEAKNQVDLFAQALLNHGIKKGDRVCVLASPSVNFLVSFLGAVQIGAIWVGLNPKYTRREIEHVLNDTEATIVFIDDNSNHLHDHLFQLSGSGISFVSFNDRMTHGFIPYSTFTQSDDKQQSELVEPQDPACIIYTSGTTGAPKGALISQYSLCKTSAIQNRLFQQHYPRILNNLPINHIGCLGDITMYALCGGGFIAFQNKFDAEGCLALIEQHKLTVWGQIPTMFQLSLDALKNTVYDLSSLQLIVFSGAPASQTLIEQLRAICSNVVNAYGMTETVGSVTSSIGCNDEALVSTIGRPVEYYDVRIATPMGESLNPGDIGEIQVSGDFHMLGYWQNPTATRDTFTGDGWLKTGDLAKELQDGAYQLTGRMKEMFKSGGYNVYPLEVEQVLETVAGVQGAVVVSVPDSLYTEVGYAFIQTVESNSYSAEQFKVYCGDYLANYKIPKYFFNIAEFPYLPNGKIDKGLLKRMACNAIKS
jgi:fatty-acyl-CoA synthase